MTADDAAASSTGADTPASWRELAVARSLDPARARAEKRVQRFLDAALELMNSGSGRDFTVQEVVERSGQSLRSFYQYFAGKHELLLALFEEAVRSAAEYLREAVDKEPEGDALARLRRCVIEHYELCRPAPRAKSSNKTITLRAMGEFAQQLLTDHPKEAARAFVPMVTLLDELLDAAGEAGVVRPHLGGSRIAGTVLQAVMFNAFAATISGTPITDDGADADELWDFILHGIGTPAS
jgi:AcrR family transcriptional regulator